MTRLDRPGVVNAYIDGDDVSEVEVSGTIANLTVSKPARSW